MRELTQGLHPVQINLSARQTHAGELATQRRLSLTLNCSFPLGPADSRRAKVGLRAGPTNDLQLASF